jgi:ParB-like nuclease domain/DNA methylase
MHTDQAIAIRQNITLCSLSELREAARNPRTHSQRQLHQIAESIRRFGFTNPVLVDNERRILAGHGRVAAARLIGMDQVPVLCIGDLGPEDRKAYALADNKIALNAGWDKELLALELQELIELDFNLELTGFYLAEIDFTLEAARDASPDTSEEPADRIPDMADAAVSRPGDLWLLGRHREFAMGVGEMSREQFTEFLGQSLGMMRPHLDPGTILFVCMDWRHMREMLDASEQSSLEMKNLVVWNKNNGGMGSFYRSKHELIFVLKHGDAPHVNSFGLGETGRHRTNVWDYPGISSISASRGGELAMHPTVKPVELVRDSIIRRFQAYTGLVAVHAMSQSRFDDLEV